MRYVTRTYRRPAGLAVLAAAAAVGLGACSSGSSTPQVASLGTSSGSGSESSAGSGSSAVAPSGGNPTELLDEWAACMRGHGDPGQADPTIDANKVIHIAFPADVTQSQQHGGPCYDYLTAAQLALRGGKPFPKGPSQAQLVEFSECMRANGVADFPDPSSGGGLNLRDVDTFSPAFRNANQVCAQKTGVPGFAPPGDGPAQPGSIVGTAG